MNKPLPRTPDEEEIKKKQKTKQTKGSSLLFLLLSHYV